MKKMNIATMMFTFNGVGDRFLKNYFDPLKPADVFHSLGGGLIRGVELQHPFQINEENIDTVKSRLKVAGLELVLINIPMASSPEWSSGTFSHPDMAVRASAVNRVKSALDVCREAGCKRVSLFFGQDGYDYAFVTDYRRVWKYFVEALAEIGDYAGDIKIAVEFKPREPRTRQFLSTAAKTMLMLDDVGAPNIGLLVDVGHVLMAGENIAETLCLTAGRNRLVHVHYNDNLRLADDDLGAGAFHLIETLESLYWLSELNYDGWISLDVHSPRENPVEIIHESAKILDSAQDLLMSIDSSCLTDLIESRDGTKLLRFIRETMLNPGVNRKRS